ncbi:MAG: hypothetical protein IPK04_12750 [Bdellovibrionales bacterium]|nr:hypothetical protein [Bdellovibrionales bacterium]
MLKIEKGTSLPHWANPKDMGLPLFTIAVGLIDRLQPMRYVGSFVSLVDARSREESDPYVLPLLECLFV